MTQLLTGVPMSRESEMPQQRMRMTMLSGAFLAVAGVCAPCPAQAQSHQPKELATETRRVHAVLTTMPIAVDGRLDEAIWETATPAANFIQREPAPGAPASFRTEARVLFDDVAFYVGMRMYDPNPDSISAHLVRRDDTGNGSDWAHVWIDSYYDRRTAFHFGTTPRASRVDMLHFDDTRVDSNWDAVWDVATSIDGQGWSAEFRIPLSQLRYSEKGSGVWGIQFGREIARRAELSYWSEWAPNAAGMVSAFGTVAGLAHLSTPRGIEFSPYTLARLTRAPVEQGDPFQAPNLMTTAAGADAKVALTSDLTLRATYNPDFGQVEADPAVVNLSSFETFFPERRPFFTEGAEIFSFPLSPEGNAFYSRRIGRAPQRFATAPDGGFVENPAAARILMAAKLSGKTASGWSIGLANALTRRSEARVADEDGAIRSEPVEPFTNYSLARISRDFRQGQSAIGVVATSTNRRLDDDRLTFLRANAHTAGINARHRFGGDIETAGWLFGSHVSGSRHAMIATQQNSIRNLQRPDAAHLHVDSTATSLRGWAGEGRLSKIGGGNWTWDVAAGARSPTVEPNDLGFIGFADSWYVAGSLNYRHFQPGRHLRNWSVSVFNVNGFTFGNERVSRELYMSAGALLRNLSSLSLNLFGHAPGISPWELRGGPALHLPGRVGGAMALSTNPRGAVAYSLGINGQQTVDLRARRLAVSPRITLRPNGRAVLSLTSHASWNQQPAQYVGTSTLRGTVQYLMGGLEQQTLSATARATWLFGPELSVDFYAEPFLSSGKYTSFLHVEDPRAHTFERRFASYSARQVVHDAQSNRYHVDHDEDGAPDFAFANPAFTVRALNTNAVLRWEFRPGSTVHMVWSQVRSDNVVVPELEIGRDLERLFEAPGRHVFMIKLSYWTQF